MMEANKTTKFILALRRYREHKRQWVEEMQGKLAEEEAHLRSKKGYLFPDVDAV